MGQNDIGFSYVSAMEVIDLATGRVSEGTAMPVAKALFGCVTVADKIMVIGGQKLRNGSIVCTSTTEVFDPVTNQWSVGVDLSTPRRGTASAVDGFVIFLGGYGALEAGRTTEVFNPREGIWRRLPALAEPINPSATVLANICFCSAIRTAAPASSCLTCTKKSWCPIRWPCPIPTLPRRC